MAYGYWYNQSGLSDCDVRVGNPIFEDNPIVPVPQRQVDCCSCAESPFPWWAIALALIVGYTVGDEKKKKAGK